MDHRVKSVPTWEARVYVGGRRGYAGPDIPEDEFSRAVAEYQEAAPENLRGCVRITRTAYRFKDYGEDGYEVGIINYPRFPLSETDLAVYARALASFLLTRLEQNRVSVVMPDSTVMFERAGAELHPATRKGD